ncbi:MAG: MBL fold metallo-hydrolase [Flavisolibacter sp.]
MQRRKFLHHTGLLVGTGLVLPKKTLAAMLDKSEYQVRMLRNNIGVFTERGGTIGFLLSRDGIIVIDAQFPDTAVHLIEELKKKNASSFQYLLNTHHHGDHTAGNIAFKGLVQHVVAHENSLANQKKLAEGNHTVGKQLFPDLTFSSDWELSLSDEKIKASYFGPGHTNGDAVYHFEKANILHVGDLMFNKRHPFVDRSAGASMTCWIRDLDSIIKLADKDTLIIFGHSLVPGEETGTVEEVKKFRDYLDKVIAFAAEEIRKGVTKEAFLRHTSIPGVTEWSGQGIERPLAAAYEELTEGK